MRATSVRDSVSAAAVSIRRPPGTGPGPAPTPEHDCWFPGASMRRVDRMKLSAKFARRESEEARQARIARLRIRGDRIAAVRQMLGLNPTHQVEPRPSR